MQKLTKSAHVHRLLSTLQHTPVPSRLKFLSPHHHFLLLECGKGKVHVTCGESHEWILIHKAFHRMDFKAFVAALHFHIPHFHSHPGIWLSSHLKWHSQNIHVFSYFSLHDVIFPTQDLSTHPYTSWVSCFVYCNEYGFRYAASGMVLPCRFLYYIYLIDIETQT